MNSREYDKMLRLSCYVAHGLHEYDEHDIDSMMEMFGKDMTIDLFLTYKNTYGADLTKQFDAIKQILRRSRT